ncbi:hypothetical protein [Streptosporangium subroseum]|uniref:hypothetical protein n=1 Tax=Streptosporangium subroseum TaxID=106412 RepID=UPI003090CEF7|nr:hypothetical protein OHB15_08245 [Streptosporangium subroseum]
MPPTARIGRGLHGVYITATVLVAAAVGLLTLSADRAPTVVALIAPWDEAFGAVPLGFAGRDQAPARDGQTLMA